jgi:hypothetical protein
VADKSPKEVKPDNDLAYRGPGQGSSFMAEKIE